MWRREKWKDEPMLPSGAQNLGSDWDSYTPSSITPSQAIAFGSRLSVPGRSLSFHSFLLHCQLVILTEPSPSKSTACDMLSTCVYIPLRFTFGMVFFAVTNFVAFLLTEGGGRDEVT